MKTLITILATLLTATTAEIPLIWDASQEPEVGGYEIQWGTSSGTYTGSTNITGRLNTNAFLQVKSAGRYFIVGRAWTTNDVIGLLSSEETAVVPKAIKLRVKTRIQGTAGIDIPNWLDLATNETIFFRSMVEVTAEPPTP